MLSALKKTIRSVGQSASESVSEVAESIILHKALIHRAKQLRTPNQPMVRREGLGESRFVVVDPWQVLSKAQRSCTNAIKARRCVKQAKARLWRAIRRHAGKLPIVTITKPPRSKALIWRETRNKAGKLPIVTRKKAPRSNVVRLIIVK